MYFENPTTETNLHLHYPSHKSHSFTSQILGDFGPHQPQPGSFLSLAGVRERTWEEGWKNVFKFQFITAAVDNISLVVKKLSGPLFSH